MAVRAAPFVFTGALQELHLIRAPSNPAAATRSSLSLSSLKMQRIGRSIKPLLKQRALSSHAAQHPLGAYRIQTGVTEGSTLISGYLKRVYYVVPLLDGAGFFPGTKLPYVPKVVFQDPRESAPIPCFRSRCLWFALGHVELGADDLLQVLNEEGDVVKGARDPELGQDLCVQMYMNMLRLNVSGIVAAVVTEWCIDSAYLFT